MHEVSLGEFLMARTPITQAQWRAVAGWKPRPEKGEIWGRDLNPDPSRFQAVRRPDCWRGKPTPTSGQWNR